MVSLSLELWHVSFSETVIIIEAFTEALRGIVCLRINSNLTIMPLNNCKFIKFLSVVRSHIFTISLRILLFVFTNFLIEIEYSYDLKQPKQGNDWECDKFSEKFGISWHKLVLPNDIRGFWSGLYLDWTSINSHLGNSFEAKGVCTHLACSLETFFFLKYYKCFFGCGNLLLMLRNIFLYLSFHSLCL